MDLVHTKCRRKMFNILPSPHESLREYVNKTKPDSLSKAAYGKVSPDMAMLEHLVQELIEWTQLQASPQKTKNSVPTGTESYLPDPGTETTTQMARPHGENSMQRTTSELNDDFSALATPAEFLSFMMPGIGGMATKSAEMGTKLLDVGETAAGLADKAAPVLEHMAVPLSKLGDSLGGRFKTATDAVAKLAKKTPSMVSSFREHAASVRQMLSGQGYKRFFNNDLHSILSNSL
jgi:hypothetical protein